MPDDRLANEDSPAPAAGAPAARRGGDGVGETIATVVEADLGELLTLMRAYCDFYDVDPSDEALLGMARALLADPSREGVQMIARDGRGGAVGFATLFWSWSTARAARVGIMNDLYLVPSARGRGLADGLIAACAERCRERGAVALEWETAQDNVRAQRVYDRVGARRESWLTYVLEIPSS